MKTGFSFPFYTNLTAQIGTEKITRENTKFGKQEPFIFFQVFFISCFRDKKSAPYNALPVSGCFRQPHRTNLILRNTGNRVQRGVGQPVGCRSRIMKRYKNRTRHRFCRNLNLGLNASPAG
jgi:hypothetical protein